MSGAVDRIVAASSWRRSGTGEVEIPKDLPADYVAIIGRLGPGEGFIGTEFLRLYSPDRLASLNERYGFPEYLPGLLLFGSNGLGEAYAFDLGAGSAIVKTAFVPLDPEYGGRVAACLSELLERFATPGAPRFAPNPETWQKELEFRHPLALGGSADPTNRVLVPLEGHVELVRFWAKTFRSVKARASDS